MRAPRARRWGGPSSSSRRATRPAWPPSLRLADAGACPSWPGEAARAPRAARCPLSGGVVLDLTAPRPDRRDRRALAHRHLRAGRQRQPARARAQRARPDAAPLPGLVGVGHGRRLRGGARLGRALHALRQDRGSRALAAGGARRRRGDRDGGGSAPRRRPRADPAVRRLGGHARRDHAGDAADRPAARATRRFATVRFPTIGAGVEAIRRALAVGARPSVVRMYDDEATRLALSPVVGQELDGVCTVLCLRGRRRGHRGGRGRTPLWRWRARRAPRSSTPSSAEIWWDRRYDFYHPPHQPELPSIWGTIDVVATYSRIEAVYDALRAAVKEPFTRRGPPAADALLALVRVGDDDLRPLRGPGRRRRTGGGGPARPHLGGGPRGRLLGRRGDERSPRRGPEARALHGAPARRVARHAAATSRRRSIPTGS